MEIKQFDATVYGFVQGVSFRFYTQREAVRLALTSGRTMRPEWRRHATIRALGATRR